MEVAGFAMSLGMVAVAIIIYFLPMFIAVLRSDPNMLAIALLNLFLGWTLIGWVAALVWSVLAKKPGSA